MIAAIVAININHAIGKNNKMLYHISEDLKHFKKVTMGNPVIMGRKTFESIGKPLPGRRNIILTRHNFDLPSDLPENTTVEICDDLTTLLNEAKWSDKTYFIIGGSDIYKQTINVVDKIYLTVIEDVNFDADAHFPLVPKEFKEIDRSEKHYDVKHKVHFTFYTLERQKNYIDNILTIMKYKVGDKVRIKSIDWYNENKDEVGNIRYKKDGSAYPIFFSKYMSNFCGKILTIKSIFKNSYYMNETSSCEFWTDEMIEGLVEDNMGEVSDGYHTFNELYEYRLLYNASFFNELAKQNLYDVHKSKKHSDGEDCFGGGHFIVMAELPTGQISNHYPIKDWSLFQVPEKEKANKWDGHTPQDVAKRIREFLTPKPKYPKTYAECCDIFGYNENLKIYRPFNADIPEYDSIQLFNSLETLRKLLICRDAYWKIAGAEMGLGEPWKPNWNDCTQHKFGLYTLENEIRCINLQVLKNIILVFPTEEMRDAFYVNFKELIESVKELL